MFISAAEPNSKIFHFDIRDNCTTCSELDLDFHKFDGDGDVNKMACYYLSQNGGCVSIFLDPAGFEYNHVCGSIRAFQKGRTDAFAGNYYHNKYYKSPINYGRTKPCTLDDNYVTGVSLTIRPTEGANRTHVWTFAAALRAGANGNSGCPCTANLGGMDNDWQKDYWNKYGPPAFIGTDYFCGSGVEADQYKRSKDVPKNIIFNSK